MPNSIHIWRVVRLEISEKQSEKKGIFFWGQNFMVEYLENQIFQDITLSTPAEKNWDQMISGKSLKSTKNANLCILWMNQLFFRISGFVLWALIQLISYGGGGICSPLCKTSGSWKLVMKLDMIPKGGPNITLKPKNPHPGHGDDSRTSWNPGQTQIIWAPPHRR